jgi:hypothetical protein
VHVTRLNRPTKDDSICRDTSNQRLSHMQNTTVSSLLRLHTAHLARLGGQMPLCQAHPPASVPDTDSQALHQLSGQPAAQHLLNGFWIQDGSATPIRQPEAIRSSEGSTACSLSFSRSRKQERVSWPRRGMPSGKTSSLDLPGTKHGTMKTKRGEPIKNLQSILPLISLSRHLLDDLHKKEVFQKFSSCMHSLGFSFSMVAKMGIFF